jgi:hypothetical protein
MLELRNAEMVGCWNKENRKGSQVQGSRFRVRDKGKIEGSKSS